MEMLSNVSMLLASDMWTNIIDAFANWIVNYGWAIIVFTICLKLVLSPLDIMQRVASQKQARVTSVMQPEINKISGEMLDKNNYEKKCDENIINLMTDNKQKLYKKYNVNLGGMCIIMLLSMVISITVVFTLFGSIRRYGDEKLNVTYQALDSAYLEAEKNYDDSITEVSKDEYAINVVIDKYQEISKQNSWLWIKNVWKSDTNTSQFVNKKVYVNYVKNTKEYKALSKEEQTEYIKAVEARYDTITSAIIKDSGSKDQNGYYVLIILIRVIYVKLIERF